MLCNKRVFKITNPIRLEWNKRLILKIVSWWMNRYRSLNVEKNCLVQKYDHTVLVIIYFIWWPAMLIPRCTLGQSYELNARTDLKKNNIFQKKCYSNRSKNNYFYIFLLQMGPLGWNFSSQWSQKRLFSPKYRRCLQIGLTLLC